MNNSEIKELCISLMKADTEDDVIISLKSASYWDNPQLWRFYGDIEKNYSEIGNQASRFDAALVEKLVNSVDARLMNECLVRGIDPEGPNAPQTLREAVATFFEEATNPKSSMAGRIKNWTNSKRTEIARGITLIATGATAREGNFSLTISDRGEGQTPEMMPFTLLSLPAVAGSNKIRIPFVQGKFNMGGSGVLRFCGRNNLQLILSRRNPKILGTKHSNPPDLQWGFTVVRRENPEGTRRSSVYTYLAPLGTEANNGRGGVLRFSANKMPIFPEGREPYARESEWGTLIKLYEYSATGYKTHILRKDGILERLDLLLPDVGLPIRLHECRPGYRGHEGSFENTLNGLSVRLDDDRGENLEADFPSSCSISALGNQMTATIYALKKGRAGTYRRNEGIIFTVNGQTHGQFTTDFFRRKNVGLSYLSDSLLVTVDCSQLPVREREDLFMNSRDRLSGTGELREEIERALEDMLKHHEGLRALKEQRRHEQIESNIDNAKPLEDILRSLIERYPSLSGLFLPGKSVANPFKTIKVKSGNGQFKGKVYPTYFKFKGKEYGEELHRDCHLNMRARVVFETDAANDYFSRDMNPGECLLYVVEGESRSSVQNYGINLHNGLATLSIELPDNTIEGDILYFEMVVTDPTRVDPFRNTLVVNVKEATETKGGRSKRRSPPSKQKGEEREQSAGIQPPKPMRVFEPDWLKHEPVFDQYTALRVKDAGDTGENGDGEGELDVYDFFVNMDNVHLLKYLKYDLKNDEKTEITRTKFELGMVLVGLALLHQSNQIKKGGKAEGKEQAEEPNIEDQVAEVTKALAPFLLPMIDSLGALNENEILVSSTAGEVF